MEGDYGEPVPFSELEMGDTFRWKDSPHTATVCMKTYDGDKATVITSNTLKPGDEYDRIEHDRMAVRVRVNITIAEGEAGECRYCDKLVLT